MFLEQFSRPGFIYILAIHQVRPSGENLVGKRHRWINLLSYGKKLGTPTSSKEFMDKKSSEVDIQRGKSSQFLDEDEQGRQKKYLRQFEGKHWKEISWTPGPI